MIIILASWFIIISICYLFGLLVNEFIIPQKSFSITIILGIILVTSIANIASFFTPINNYILYFIALISFGILLVKFKEIKQQLLLFKNVFLNTKNAVLLLLSAILFAAYSSGYSNINDDGLYYTQTIMWLRQYGLVHGISNLHLSLGLSSSWHVFQALFTFSDKINLNDANGFLMFVFTLFIIENTNNKNSNFFHYIQYVLVLIISIPFYSAPNPDFAIIVFTAIAINLFLLSNHQKNEAVILLLAAFCFTIKISAICISILAVYVLFGFIRKTSFRTNQKVYFFILFILVIHIGKNLYQTAYPLYPYKIWSINADWKTPETIVSYFTNGVKTWSYSNKFKPNDVAEIQQISQWQLLQNLLFRQGTKGLINKLIFSSFIICFLLIIYLWFKQKLNQKTIVLQAVAAFSLIVWFVFAPQYRFAIPMLIYYLSFIIQLIYVNFTKRFFAVNTYYFQLIIIAILFIPTIFGMKISGNETSKQIGTFDKIKSEQIIFPMPKYSFEKMDTITINNTNYYHVNGNTYCWNSPLPCMSKGYEKIIFESFKCRISLRGKSLDEGFKFICEQ